MSVPVAEKVKEWIADPLDGGLGSFPVRFDGVSARMFLRAVMCDPSVRVSFNIRDESLRIVLFKGVLSEEEFMNDTRIALLEEQ